MACTPSGSVPIIGCCGGVACHVSVSITKIVHDKNWNPAAYAALLAELEATPYPNNLPALPEGFVTTRIIRDDYRSGHTDEVSGGQTCIRSIWFSTYVADDPGISQMQAIKLRVCDRGRWCSYATWGPSEGIQPNFIACDHGVGVAELHSPDLASLAPQNATPTQNQALIANKQLIFPDSSIAFERVFSCDGTAIKACCSQAP